MTNEERTKVEAVIKRCLGGRLEEQKVIIGLFLDQKGLKEVADELGLEPRRVVPLRDEALRHLRSCQEFFALLEDL